MLPGTSGVGRAFGWFLRIRMTMEVVGVDCAAEAEAAPSIIVWVEGVVLQRKLEWSFRCAVS